MARFTIGGIELEVPDALLTNRIAEKLQTGAYEADERRAALMRLRPGQTVLDLGAGLGFIAASCAAITGAENVTAVEANPDLIEVIERNLTLNGYGGATLIHGAVSGTDTSDKTTSFDMSKAFWAGRIVEDGSNAASVRQVPHVPLHALLEQVRPEQIVIDVEGAEAHFFDTRWPEYVRRVVLELHPKRYPDATIKKIVDCLSASGLTYDPGPSVGRILCFRRVRNT
ncbi:MAG: FkbM family methyltransferase [Pseudomonadota bacterium]